ncbi:MAG: DUF1800 family protein [Acidobacteriota bacterium]
MTPLHDPTRIDAPKSTEGAVRPEPPASSSALNRRHFFALGGAFGAAAGVAALAGPPAFAQGGTTLTPQQSASRFLSQCTLGADLALVNEVMNAGLGSWLDAQMALPVVPFLPEVQQLIDSGAASEGDEYLYFDWVWWQRAMTAPDVVRTRVAFALSQIFVISRRVELLLDTPKATAAMQDLLLRGAFGNFRDLLRDVALNPAMGFYLSHLFNRRSDPAQNRFPDENFAREVMQLFSIGLHELNPDGTWMLDSAGQPIPTYGNAQITEMAKIFTGLAMTPVGDLPIDFGDILPTWDQPMVMYEPEHEPGPKTLLNGLVVPAGQTGMQDIEMAIDNLFQHPNVGPFLGTHLIKFLVTSNPSPAYVARVSAAFADNGTGVRGDMKAVVKAVLLDVEARDVTRIDDPQFGRVREPFGRWVQIGRAFHATSASGRFRHYGGDDVDEAGFLQQYPYFAPSVFNFFSPNHQPPGPLAAAGLVAPELEIIHAYTSVAAMNRIGHAVVNGEYLRDRFETAIPLDLATEVGIAQTSPTALVDHLDLLLTYGTLSGGTRQIILDAIMPLSGDPNAQVQLAIYLMLVCPEFGVQR